MKLRTVLLFGAPGSGKGTQGRVLGDLPGYFHCSCGEVFRSLKMSSPLGEVFAEYSSKGELVPDKPTIELWRQYIETTRKTGRFDPAQDVLLLDGIPRNLHQAELMSETLAVKALVYLTCADTNKLTRRLQRRALKENRLDDANAEVIRQRLETYEIESQPVLKFYGASILHRVDAAQRPLEVLRDVVGVLLSL